MRPGQRVVPKGQVRYSGNNFFVHHPDGRRLRDGRLLEEFHERHSAALRTCRHSFAGSVLGRRLSVRYREVRTTTDTPNYLDRRLEHKLSDNGRSDADPVRHIDSQRGPETSLSTSSRDPRSLLSRLHTRSDADFAGDDRRNFSLPRQDYGSRILHIVHLLLLDRHSGVIRDSERETGLRSGVRHVRPRRLARDSGRLPLRTRNEGQNPQRDTERSRRLHYSRLLMSLGQPIFLFFAVSKKSERFRRFFILISKTFRS